MTAYSFQPQFEAPILAGTKDQTIRAYGRRSHAKLGGLVQLYVGMRTKGCRKIRPDVVCIGLLPVSFDLRPPHTPKLHVDCRWIGGDEAEAFARRDGFDRFSAMVDFWLATHGTILFEGVCIRWAEPDKAGPGVS